MPAGKKQKKNPDEEKEDVETIYLNEKRSAFIDIILCTTTIEEGKNKKMTTKYEVEKAVLACQSITFLNMFNDCVTRSKEKVAEISIPEPAKLVSSFLHIIYGTFQEGNDTENDEESFDHWVDVIDMGDKYLANVVIDRSIRHLCRAFRSLSVSKGNDKFPHTRYGRAIFMKFIVILSQLESGQLAASELATEEIECTIKGTWLDFCSKCGINAEKRTRSSITHSLCRLKTLLPDEKVKYFDALDIVAFQRVIEDVPQENFDIIKVVRRHFVE